MPALWQILLCIIGGALSGIINTIAGGGSIITLSMLMALGLPADIANGTNRPSIVTQATAGVWGFHKRGFLDHKRLPFVLTFVISGGILGSIAAAYWVDPGALKKIFLVALVLMAIIVAFQPAAFSGIAADESRRAKTLNAIFLFGSGFYGGFIQAGVGLFLLAVLGGRMRYALANANALKLSSTLSFGLFALAIFAFAGQINWYYASAVALGSWFGAEFGVRLAGRIPKWAGKYLVLTSTVICVIIAFLQGE